MTPPMVERVARAIYAQRNGTGCVPWSRRDNAHKAPYLDDALAALRAMREPTRGMLEGAERAVMLGAENHTGGCGKCHIDAYRAAIDAAINEGK